MLFIAAALPIHSAEDKPPIGLALVAAQQVSRRLHGAVEKRCSDDRGLAVDCVTIPSRMPVADEGQPSDGTPSPPGAAARLWCKGAPAGGSSELFAVTPTLGPTGLRWIVERSTHASPDRGE
jgi:hypothetical protein